MFRYEDTNKISKPSEIQRKVVTKVRRVTYINPGKATLENKEPENVTTEGFEIVKEIVVSPDYQLTMPEVVDSKAVYHPSLR